MMNALSKCRHWDDIATERIQANDEQMSSVLQATRKDDLEKDRAAFFKEVQGGKDIDLPTFTAYVRVARNLPGSGLDLNKQARITFDQAFAT
jgi:hypothetical protein